MVCKPRIQLREQGLFATKSAVVQPGIGVLYAAVQDVEKAVICWNRDSVIPEEDEVVERWRRLAKANHDGSATLGRRRIALGWMRGDQKAKKEEQEVRVFSSDFKVLGRATADFGVWLLLRVRGFLRCELVVGDGEACGTRSQCRGADRPMLPER